MEERQIFVDPPNMNPFLQQAPSSSSSSKTHPSSHLQQKQGVGKKTVVWISPFKERNRYLVDFEAIKVVGEGAFSLVYSARRRLDGQLYAIKRLKLRCHPRYTTFV